MISYQNVLISDKKLNSLTKCQVYQELKMGKKLLDIMRDKF